MYVNIDLCYSFNNILSLAYPRAIADGYCLNFFCPAGSDEDESNKLTYRQTMERKGFVPLQSHTNTKYFVHTTKRCVIFFVLFSYCGSLFHTRWRGILL